MAKRVSWSEVGNTLVGRILSFERVRGYGFIRTQSGEDIFLSSYDVPNCVWKRISVGDYVEFTVGKNEKLGSPIIATSTTIIKKMPRDLAIKLPNGEELKIRYICQYGKKSLIKDGFKDLYPDYADDSFDYVCIKTSRESFMFNRYGSPIVVDGETDVDEFYRSLTNLLLDYDIDRDYESF